MILNRDFDKKIIKIYKALRVMEKSKLAPPKLSDEFKDLALTLQTNYKSDGNETMSRYSIGETFKGGYDQMSNLTGANAASFKPGRFQSVRQTEGSLGSEDNYNYTSQKEIPSAEDLNLLPPPRNCKSREINRRANYPHREMNSADTSLHINGSRPAESGADGFL
jgi:hypothetical protein